MPENHVILCSDSDSVNRFIQEWRYQPEKSTSSMRRLYYGSRMDDGGEKDGGVLWGHLMEHKLFQSGFLEQHLFPNSTLYPCSGKQKEFNMGCIQSRPDGFLSWQANKHIPQQYQHMCLEIKFPYTQPITDQLSRQWWMQCQAHCFVYNCPACLCILLNTEGLVVWLIQWDPQFMAPHHIMSGSCKLIMRLKRTDSKYSVGMPREMSLHGPQWTRHLFPSRNLYYKLSSAYAHFMNHSINKQNALY